MDQKQIRKMLTADRLRRQIARDREVEASNEKTRAAVDKGYQMGRQAAPRAVPVGLPSGYVDSVIRSMIGCFAREAMEQINGKVPYQVFHRVAEKVWDHIKLHGGPLDDELVNYMIESIDPQGNLRIDVVVQPMRRSQVIDRHVVQDLVRR